MTKTIDIDNYNTAIQSINLVSEDELDEYYIDPIEDNVELLNKQVKKLRRKMRKITTHGGWKKRGMFR